MDLHTTIIMTIIGSAFSADTETSTRQESFWAETDRAHQGRTSPKGPGTHSSRLTFMRFLMRNLFVISLRLCMKRNSRIAFILIDLLCQTDIPHPIIIS